MLLQDTIAAIITPPGEGGIAAIRVAGPESHRLVTDSVLSRQLEPITFEPLRFHYGLYVDESGNVIDEVMAVTMPQGHSYTGLSQAELFCHGGRVVVQVILEDLVARGARVAEPGEFTRLAFLNGRIDLVRAEAVAETIAANSRHSLQTSREHLLGFYSEHIEKIRAKLLSVLSELEASIDFSESEDYSAPSNQLLAECREVRSHITKLIETYDGGKLLTEGFKVVLAGRPNAGKSSLFNLLLSQQRALVTPIPGTTRDYLSEWIELSGMLVQLTDTAGLRATESHIELLGQQKAKQVSAQANLIIWLVDISEQGWQSALANDLKNTQQSKTIVVGNKADLVPLLPNFDELEVAISCRSGKGVNELKALLADKMRERLPDLTGGLVVTSARHKSKLNTAALSLEQAELQISSGESPDITAESVKQAIQALDEIVGRVYTEAVLGEIFSKFCVGK